MNTKLLITLFTILLFLGETKAQAPTFAKDIAPIIYNKCTNCHRPGEIGPMPFTNYNEVKLSAFNIKMQVQNKTMPPWKADPNYSRFKDENFLSDQEIQLIADWVDAGSPYGNVIDEPPLPDFPEGSVLGEPDLVLSFAEKHVQPGTNQDEYWYFSIPTGLTEDKYVKAIEMRPGNKELVHHALLFQDTTGEAAQNNLDYDQAYGFPNNFQGFGTGTPGSNVQFPIYVPGQKSIFFPEGTAQLLSAGSDLVVQVHYAPTPVEQNDSSTFNIFFADEEEEIDRLIKDRIMLPNDLSSLFLLPPDDDSIHFHGTWEIEEDLSLLFLSPHMHYLGKSWEVWLEKPNGETENLIKINDWDFNWQGDYYFRKFIVAPAGSVVHAIAVYDNSANNPFNPSDPPNWVTWGEDTDEEMYYLPIYYVNYKDGDEDIVFEEDDITSLNELGIYTYENKIYNIYPNPVSEGNVSFNFSLERGGPVDISLYDMSGRLVRNLRSGEFFSMGQHTIPFSINNLSEGVYTLQLSGNKFKVSDKLIISNK